MDANKAKEIINKKKLQKDSNEFEKLYKEYKKTIKSATGGLVKANKSDFIKMYAFYSAVSHPNMLKMWEVYLGKDNLK